MGADGERRRGREGRFVRVGVRAEGGEEGSAGGGVGGEGAKQHGVGGDSARCSACGKEGCVSDVLASSKGSGILD